MSPVTAFRLGPGDPAPTQQSSVSCGSACLTVARMMIDPALTRWILRGVGPGGARDDRPVAARFAEHEQEVLARTNAVVPRPGSVQAPWPRALGTPPWGARVELENGAALAGTPYATTWLRGLSGERLAARVDRLVGLVDVGAPMLLYVGNGTLPRHVTLVFVAADGGPPALYDPAGGRVGAFPAAGLADRRLGLSGWDQPWVAVHPSGALRSRRRTEVLAALRGRFAGSPVPEGSAWSRAQERPGPTRS
ncbi:hypothetical protein [Agilicoccus flavus]|uniref:hypothetical protein n=1 Tax=Agilicoccus flavus TaxID=2775968 RepID=UPI001CF672AF|nr:hypothetical protein [Agilicoccus flavus]